MKTLLAATAAMALPAAANAAIILGSVTPGTVPYSGPTPTYDFRSPTPNVTGGLITNTSESGVGAQPYGSTGSFWTVGPDDGSPGNMDLSSFGNISNISFIWGSVDGYNLLEFLDAGGNVLASFTGADVFNPANGNQTDPNTNPVVRFNLTDGDQTAFTTLRLSSTSNAFETDNFAINAVPEPATWALMMIGFAAVGFGMRRRRPQVSVRYA
ncbi:PEPxxWA-CTERM sorting domain-containing protein [Sphingopyxis sp.]|uniref:Npun_F0296 family exosortase-dependent surface protein n=1 Tax=Sphingopyxis sp. TaxID=1908224 RepID=UPI0026013604|nr:PEPxxWA-CTERM sorting domain-containing protein [Sphingopyxis sp.]MBK6414314.1 PEP-CTERM sorting domain-containing protein [Sphingopyxis sp.]